MDTSWGLEKEKENKRKGKVSWVLWKGALAIGGGKVAAAMAIVASALTSDHQN